MHANRTILFLLETLFVVLMMLACMSVTVKDARAYEAASYEEAGYTEYEYYDEKSGAYVTERQYRVYRFIDFWIKKAGLAVAILCLVGGFVFRRIDKVDAVFRMKALRMEIVVPTLYIIVAYVVCYYADRFV